MDFLQEVLQFIREQMHIEGIGIEARLGRFIFMSERFVQTNPGILDWQRTRYRFECKINDELFQKQLEELRSEGLEEKVKRTEETNWQEYRKIVDKKTGRTRIVKKLRLKTLDIMIDSEKKTGIRLCASQKQAPDDAPDFEQYETCVIRDKTRWEFQAPSSKFCLTKVQSNQENNDNQLEVKLSSQFISQFDTMIDDQAIDLLENQCFNKLIELTQEYSQSQVFDSGIQQHREENWRGRRFSRGGRRGRYNNKFRNHNN